MAMRTRKAFGATIKVGSESYHTFNDLGFTLVNDDAIGEPSVETNYLDIPGRHDRLDYSEALTGRPVYKMRSIALRLQEKHIPMRWDLFVSWIRNVLHGRRAQVSFDNDGSHYWEGRIYVQEVSRDTRIGSLILAMPEAGPFKFDTFSSIEDYDWDTFDFEYDYDRYIGTLEITDGYRLTILENGGAPPVVPVFNVDSITSDTLTVRSSSNNKTYTLARGRNRFPDLLCAGAKDVELVFNGSGILNVEYRAVSL